MLIFNIIFITFKKNSINYIFRFIVGVIMIMVNKVMVQQMLTKNPDWSLILIT